MQSFILHLARSNEREGLVRDLMGTLPNARVLPAVDGATLSSQSLAAVYQVKQVKPYYPFALKAGEVGCFLSHRSAWDALVKSNAPAAWIAEDDVVIDGNKFDSIMNLIDPHITPDGLIRIPLRNREVAKHVISESGEMTLMRPKKIALSAALYLVGRTAAKRLLDLTAPFDRPVDTFLQMRWLTKIDSLVVQNSGARSAAYEVGTSTIQSKKSMAHEIKRMAARAMYRAHVARLSRKSVS